MRKIKKIPITREGYEKLKKEYEELKRSRPEAVKTLSEARNMGDLSENGLYAAAKARLRSIDSQMFRLLIQIKLADIVQTTNKESIGIGSKFEVGDGKTNKIMHLVGDFEANPLEGKISRKSPIGRALLGKKINDRIEFEAPKGKLSYTILRIF